MSWNVTPYILVGKYLFSKEPPVSIFTVEECGSAYGIVMCVCRSGDSSVSVVTRLLAERLRNCNRTIGRGKKLFSSPSRADWL